MRFNIDTEDGRARLIAAYGGNVTKKRKRSPSFGMSYRITYVCKADHAHRTILQACMCEERRDTTQ